jgi:hypothetical protein
MENDRGLQGGVGDELAGQGAPKKTRANRFDSGEDVCDPLLLAVGA